jgi:hypothetical protein
MEKPMTIFDKTENPENHKLILFFTKELIAHLERVLPTNEEIPFSALFLNVTMCAFFYAMMEVIPPELEKEFTEKLAKYSEAAFTRKRNKKEQKND